MQGFRLQKTNSGGRERGVFGYWTRLAMGGALFAPAALVAASGQFGAAAVEARLETAAKAELARRDLLWATVRANGRTLQLYFPTGEDGESAAALLAGLPGVAAALPVAITPGGRPEAEAPRPIEATPEAAPAASLEIDEPAPVANPADICRTAINRTLNGRRLTFQYDSATLGEMDIGLLRALTAALSACEGLTLIVEGHTDSTGPEDANLRLSQRRAETVANFIRNAGAPVKVEAASFGETRPIASNQSETGREANRRIDFVIPATLTESE